VRGERGAVRGAQLASGLAVLVPVAAGAGLVLWLAPGMWWPVFAFGWISFPAFGLLVRGVAGLADGGERSGAGAGGERELLGEHGELTPARAAMETSLTVAEADALFGGLAREGHLRVRGHGGGISYSLWDSLRDADAREEPRGAP